ncbi:MAG: FAD-dependent oxidoreductase [Tepidamorphaceae bacterium]|nr:FAD-binding oxidoreductase [Rhodobiaceae bacterium]MCC0049729.1 FAD-binding oxidoreductase [Rhodobiaceae bacterium]
MADSAYAVIGGGLVGMAIAWGLANRGKQVTVFDEGDRGFRASRGNFGLVWVQSKGLNMPDYSRWSRLSAQLWPKLSEELGNVSGTDLELSQPGGIHLFLDEDEAEKAVADMEKLRAALGGDYPFEYLGHNAVKRIIPEIGPEVVGALHSPMDGHVNPLYLLRALHTGVRDAGAKVLHGPRVERITHTKDGFRIHREDGVWSADNVVLCAGLGNARLAPMIGLDAPVVPNRGQVIITERVRPFLNVPTAHVRQVGEGAVQIGDSKEAAGFDDSTSKNVIAKIAHRATRYFPLLENVRVVRTWGALRVMSPDGHPIYDKSQTCPGASLVTCHSGVTLAAAHAKVLAGWICGEDAPDYMEVFGAQRFALQKAG